MRTIGPRQITERARSSPTAKKQGRRRRSRASQLLATTSGPTPAGSPSATARGGRARASTVLPIVDNRVAAKVAQIALGAHAHRSEEHTSELQSLMRISYAVFCLKTTNKDTKQQNKIDNQE